MKIPQDALFREERSRFAFRFNCEDCTLFDPDRDACAHGYPTAAHRRARYDDPDVDILFCKDFDLL